MFGRECFWVLTMMTDTPAVVLLCFGAVLKCVFSLPVTSIFMLFSTTASSYVHTQTRLVYNTFTKVFFFFATFEVWFTFTAQCKRLRHQKYSGDAFKINAMNSLIYKLHTKLSQINILPLKQNQLPSEHNRHVAGRLFQASRGTCHSSSVSVSSVSTWDPTLTP